MGLLDNMFDNVSQPVKDETVDPDEIEVDSTDVDDLPDAPPSGPLCEVCSEPIEWSGRGRKPKKCVLHKSRTTPRETGAGPRVSRRSAKDQSRLDALEADLLQEQVMFGKQISNVLPVFGCVSVARAPKTAAALAKIAGKHPKVLDALEVVTKIVPALDLAETFLMLAVALMIDTGRMGADAVGSRMTGVYEIWVDLYGDDPNAPATFNNVPSVPQPMFSDVRIPPRFEQMTV